MASGEICSAVNALFRAVCELKMNDDKNTTKSQMQFFADLTRCRRALVHSFILYEYFTYENLTITKDELDLMREFIITYLGKYDDPCILDVFLTYADKSLKFAIVCFERASKTNDTANTIREIELDITRVYENSVFKILEQIASSLPADETILKIKNLQKYFKNGNLISKFNENILGNYQEIEKYILSTSTGKSVPQFNPVNCGIGPSPYEPYAPYEPHQPFEPSEPSDFITLDFISKKIGNIGSLSDDMPNLNEANIKAAIGRILEISTTEELTQV